MVPKPLTSGWTMRQILGVLRLWKSTWVAGVPELGIQRSSGLELTQGLEVLGCQNLLGAQRKPKNPQVLGLGAKAVTSDAKSPYL